MHIQVGTCPTANLIQKTKKNKAIKKVMLIRNVQRFLQKKKMIRTVELNSNIASFAE
jgi:hypothetical protein